jgi:cytochrome c-type biogenesis protein
MHLEHKPVGFLGSALVGMAFGAGWTPCIGPVLGAILGLAATSADLSRGMLLLAVYSAGLAVPFLVAAVAVERFLDWFQRFRKYLPWVMRISGALLVLVGVLLLTGEFTRLAGWLQSFTPEFLRRQL